MRGRGGRLCFKELRGDLRCRECAGDFGVKYLGFVERPDEGSVGGLKVCDGSPSCASVKLGPVRIRDDLVLGYLCTVFGVGFSCLVFSLWEKVQASKNPVPSVRQDVWPLAFGGKVREGL